ncbi:hypothetical protein Pelo_2098 [Pelomyxa schiedti]|nr:hypothetical protein Pelo_2098 [Pelomyxa schiedti]
MGNNNTSKKKSGSSDHHQPSPSHSTSTKTTSPTTSYTSSHSSSSSSSSSTAARGGGSTGGGGGTSSQLQQRQPSMSRGSQPQAQAHGTPAAVPKSTSPAVTAASTAAASATPVAPEGKMQEFSMRLSDADVKKLSDLWLELVGSKTETVSYEKFTDIVKQASKLFPDLLALKEPEFAQQLFTLLDVDHSNTISYQELFGGLAVMAKGDMKDKAALVFYACDANGDGTLTRQELTQAFENALYNAQMLVTIQTGRTMIPSFPGFDGMAILRKNAAEGAARSVELHRPHIQQAIDKIFEADDNDDGVLSLEEWCTHCETVPEIRAFFKFATGGKLINTSDVAVTELAAQNPFASEADLSDASAAAGGNNL